MLSDNCTIIVDIDGTLIPALIDFERLRAELRNLLKVDHPLKPLGESLAKLQIDVELKRKAWALVERAELESIDLLRVEEVRENVELVNYLVSKGIRVVLVTMRSLATTLPLLSRLNMVDLASNVITRDLHTSRLRQLEHVVNSSTNRRLVFIGDTSYDEIAARTLGIPFIRVGEYREFPLAVYDALRKCESSGNVPS